ncbi:hypothetical protein JYU34_005050 [Plutella xylostella]|uniref:Uncharacterized protein n=1 Tax=Plutella xylostella TaxID=51655 RepID=A0ABQ7QVQ1_PLUXY|nr:uncharacterized protein LOC105382663 [Plutella xylostella]XP_048478092.1 uncharacterized protein LOC105382663 [Plutella xylostella]KAG7309130.1 hypothetical protein JYU34_005050 [Plutella xylostella]
MILGYVIAISTIFGIGLARSRLRACYVNNFVGPDDPQYYRPHFPVWCSRQNNIHQLYFSKDIEHEVFGDINEDAYVCAKIEWIWQRHEHAVKVARGCALESEMRDECKHILAWKHIHGYGYINGCHTCNRNWCNTSARTGGSTTKELLLLLIYQNLCLFLLKTFLL